MGKVNIVALGGLRYLAPMDLHTRDLGGSGPLVVILHGLFGSSQNWAGMGRRLAAAGRVFALDLRNHGDSPHAASMTLADCVEDLREWLAARPAPPAVETAPSPRAAPAIVIGHSLGGIVAMGFAIAHPELVAGVCSIDIAPRPYPRDHAREIACLQTDISGCATRTELDALLAPVLPDERERAFLLMNAVRDGPGFRWRLNVPGLKAQTVSDGLDANAGTFGGEAMLVACGRSPYVRKEDHAAMFRHFPRARIETIPDADHWPHVTAPDALQAVLMAFIRRAAPAAAPMQ